MVSSSGTSWAATVIWCVCGHGLGLAVERLGNRLNEAEVVHQQAGIADQEVAVFGDGQVIDLLGCAGLDRFEP